LFGHAQAMGPNAAVQDFHAQTFKRLTDAGAQVAVGSDDPIRTTRTEVNYFFHLRDANTSTLLRVLCENTPRAIFPGRKLGKIEDGYEASFLVLQDNPLNNLLKIRAIAMKVKNGVLLK
ncbi:MAG TPA: hypothetical protein PK858_10540, partial [Saprospiraceae bacterium]|nr:hypothetical protein [Saprospiraceae bacterium]